MSTTRRALSVACSALMGAVILDCAEPTSFLVEVVSEVPCEAGAQVLIVGGTRLAELGAKAPSASAMVCEPAGDGTYRRGDIVLVPASATDAPVAFQLVTRADGEPPETACAADKDGAGCIVARRQLQYRARTSQRLRVDLRLSCLGVRCAPEETCVRGACVPAEVRDLCRDRTCDESELGTPPPVETEAGATDDAGADAGVPSLAACAPEAPVVLGTGALGSSPSVVATERGFVVAWVTSAGAGLETRFFDENGRDVGRGGPYAAATGNVSLIGRGRDRLGLVYRDSAVRFLVLDARGGALGPPLDVLGMPTVNVHGVPFAGDAWGLGAGTATGAMAFTTLASDGRSQRPVREISAAGTWITTAASRDRFAYSWREGTTCLLQILDTNGLPVSARIPVATSCYDAHVAASPDGWRVSFHTSTDNAARMASFTPDGTLSGPVVTVSEPAIGTHSVLVAPLASRQALVVYADRNSAAVHSTQVAPGGRIVVPGAPIPGVVAARHDVAPLVDRVGVVSISPSAQVSFRVRCAPPR